MIPPEKIEKVWCLGVTLVKRRNFFLIHVVIQVDVNGLIKGCLQVFIYSRNCWSQSTVSIHLQMTVSIHNLALKIKLCYINFFYIVPFHYSSKIIAWNLKWCQQEETLRLVYPLGWQKNESHKWSWCQMPYLWQRNGLQQYQVAHPFFTLWNKLSIFWRNFFK